MMEYLKGLMLFLVILVGMVAFIAGITFALMWCVDLLGPLEDHRRTALTFLISMGLSGFAAYHMTGPMKELLRKPPRARRPPDAMEKKLMSPDSHDPLFPWLPKQ